MEPIAESRQTKICLHVYCKNGFETRRCDIAFAFQLCFRMCHQGVQADQEGLKLIGTHQLLFYNDDLNVLGVSICTIKENTETSVFISNEIGLELNDKKTKYMVMSQDQHAVKNHNIYIQAINPLKGWNTSNIWEQL